MHGGRKIECAPQRRSYEYERFPTDLCAAYGLTPLTPYAQHFRALQLRNNNPFGSRGGVTNRRAGHFLPMISTEKSVLF